MKPGLSLRVSQHLALTPQLQQSIKLLQLSTLELASEVEQMLDDNPFLERANDDAPREEFGIAHENTPVADEARDADSSLYSATSTSTTTSTTSSTTAEESQSGESAAATEQVDWGGDGTVEI